MSAETDKSKLEELNEIALEKQNKLTAGENITIDDDVISCDIDNSFWEGSSNVTSLEDIPTDYRLVIANIDTDQDMSIGDGSFPGMRLDVIVNNTSDNFVCIGLPSDWIVTGDSLLAVKVDSSIIIHIDYDGDTYYAHTCGDAEYDSEYSTASDVVFYDSVTNSKIIVPAGLIKESSYPLSRYTPIGIMVIPPSHNVYGTGEGAMMTLVEMSYSTPDSGQLTSSGMYWGQYNVDTGLPNLNTCVTTGTTASPTEEASGTATNSYLPSDDFSTSNPVCPTDPLAHYYYNSSSYSAAPSPYLSDGSRNPVYYQTESPSSELNCLADFDGIGNTNVLLDLVTAQPDWKTDETITESSGSGYSPAACCCWRFSTPGTNQGDWYLPACGELGYVLVRRKAINDTISTLNEIYGTVGLAVSSSYYHWSSSEYSSSYARYINHYGNVSYYNKGTANRVRAFARV